MEFSEVMRHYRRFCDERSRIAAENEYDYDCKNCPLEHNDVCAMVAAGYTDEGVAEFEEFITKWAEEHPEPKYPTWAEWLELIGLIIRTRNGTMAFQFTKAFENVPDDIAQNLGLKLKEG